MNVWRWFLLIFAVLAIMALLAVATAASAQTAGRYNLTWSTVDGGGSYSLTGTACQPDTGTLTGGGYAVASSFWAGLTQAVQLLLALIRR